MIFIKKLTKCKILLAAPFYTLCDHPKFNKIHNNENYIIFETNVLAREVSQKSFLALPCCMGVVFFDPHPAWECKKQLLQHLPGENAIFFIFSTPPQREAQKSSKCSSWTNLSAPRRQRRDPQIVAKMKDHSGDFLFVNVWDSSKSHSDAQKYINFLQSLTSCEINDMQTFIKNNKNSQFG